MLNVTKAITIFKLLTVAAYLTDKRLKSTCSHTQQKFNTAATSWKSNKFAKVSGDGKGRLRDS